MVRVPCKVLIYTRYHPKASGDHPQAFGNTPQNDLRWASSLGKISRNRKVPHRARTVKNTPWVDNPSWQAELQPECCCTYFKMISGQPQLVDINPPKGWKSPPKRWCVQPPPPPSCTKPTHYFFYQKSSRLTKPPPPPPVLYHLFRKHNEDNKTNLTELCETLPNLKPSYVNSRTRGFTLSTLMVLLKRWPKLAMLEDMAFMPRACMP